MVNRVILTSMLLLLVPLWTIASTVTLPKTGQTLCYDANGAIDCANTGQDGETQIGAAWPNPRFTDNLNGTVTDNLTGLIWLKDASCTYLNPPPANPSLSQQGGRDWASALIAANTLASGQCNLGDGSTAGTWRLPNVNEFESLMDISQSNPPLPPNHHFTNLPTLPLYWTSTTTGDYFPGINAIGADLYNGTIQGDAKSSLKYILPVKGDSLTLAKTGQKSCWDPANGDPGGLVVPCNGIRSDGDLQKGVPLPYPRFFDNGNGTTTDALTGLIWLRNAGCFSNISSQRQALTLAKTLASGTCDLVDGSVPGDWRVPNRKELRSLVDYGTGWLLEFPGSPSHGWYWSSDSNVMPTFTSDKWMVKSQGLDWLASTLLTYQQLPPYFMLPVRGVLKVQRITFNAPATIRYGDPPLDLSTVTAGGGSGNPVTFTLVSGPATLNGTTLTFTGGGNVVVKASQAGNGTYYPAADTPHTFVVDSSSGSVVITPADLSRTYDGTPKAVTATTTPPGMNVTLSYGGSATPPTNAGSYPVVATINDATHQGSSSATLVIARAAGTVTLGGLSQTYNGTARSATATTSPAGGNVTFTYAGSATPPTNAGSYPVVATIDDPNFQSGSASGTLVIAKATATVTLGGLNQVYDGNAKSVTATTSPAGKSVSFSYTPANPINAGSYAVVATVSDANYSGTASGTLTLAKKTPTVTWGPPAAIASGTALGAAQLNATASVPGGFVYTPAAGTVPPAGTQTLAVVFTPTDTVNYATAGASVLLTVAPSFTVTFDPGGGTLTGPASQTVASGASTTAVTAVPPAGYHFVQWTSPGGFTSTSNPLTVGPVTANQTLTANYAANTYLVTFDPGGGTLTGSASQTVARGASTTAVTAVPPAGYHFVQWTGPGGFTSTSNPLTVGPVTANQTLTANYAVNTYLVTFDPGGGTLTGAASQTVASGASTTAVTAVPPAGYHFVQWTGPGGFTSTSNPLTVGPVTANRTLTSNYAVNSYLVTTSVPGGNGGVSCTSPVDYGANSVCTLTPDPGYHVFTLTDNDADRMSALAGGSFTITGVSASHLVSATFARPNGILNPADGKTRPDIADALAVLNMVLKITPSTPADLARADIAPLGSDGNPSGDGVLDIYDVIGILRMSLGL